jgi:dihydroorotate dehydrogenase
MPFWKYLPAQWAHDWSAAGLSLYSGLQSKVPADWKSFDWKGLHFRNRLGIAGGVDKNAEQILAWQNIGAGFVEVGTVTPLPQKPNPGKILDRDWAGKNLWNKMGFPSEGYKSVRANLAAAQSTRKIPVFLNVGKNRETPNEKAINDYVEVIRNSADYADAIVLNVSSPNTAGLRELQNETYLSEMVKIVCELTSKPVLIKLSPDLTLNQLESSLKAAAKVGVSGFILTNTTLSRPDGNPFPKEGGLSGASLSALSKQALDHCVKILGSDKNNYLIVSVGGVLSPDDVAERLSMGADLVQIYSALIFNGLGIFKEVSQYFNKEGGAL